MITAKYEVEVLVDNREDLASATAALNKVSFENGNVNSAELDEDSVEDISDED